MQAVSHNTLRFDELLKLDGVREDLVLRSNFGFCAFHGGNLERVTDYIASTAAEASDSSFYAVRQPPGMRQHISSAKVDPAQSDKLRQFIDHCDFVIAIHGYGRVKHWATLQLGGRNRALAGHLAHHLRWHLPAYKVIDNLEDIPKGLRGQHTSNPCNLSRGGGVQLELPPRVRGQSPMARFWPTENEKHGSGSEYGDENNFAHTHDLVAGLVSAARAWPRVT